MRAGGDGAAEFGLGTGFGVVEGMPVVALGPLYMWTARYHMTSLPSSGMMTRRKAVTYLKLGKEGSLRMSTHLEALVIKKPPT